MSLNRLSWLRPSSVFLNSAASSQKARWLVFDDGRPLVDSSSSSLVKAASSDVLSILGRAPVFGQTQTDGEVAEGPKPLAASRLHGPPVVFLGWREPDDQSLRSASDYRHPASATDLPGTPFFAISIENVPEGDRKRLLERGASNWSFVEPRSASAYLDAWDTTIFAVARSMLDWNKRMKFCPSCGHRSHSIWGGWRRCCSTHLPWVDNSGLDPCPTSSGLHNTEFPRTDPVVIVAATSEDGETILLGRNKKYSRPYFSLIAGFMEPGESAEDAAARELWEEAGIVPQSVREVSTQAWPHPSNLMIGCRAVASSTQIPRTDIDDELAEARWFTRASVLQVLQHTRGPNIPIRRQTPPTSETTDDEPPFLLPPPSAISGVLISNWAYQRE